MLRTPARLTASVRPLRTWLRYPQAKRVNENLLGVTDLVYLAMSLRWLGGYYVHAVSTAVGAPFEHLARRRTIRYSAVLDLVLLDNSNTTLQRS